MKKSQYWLVPVVSLVLLLALLISACADGSTSETPIQSQSPTSGSPAASPKYGGTLVVAEGIFYGKPLGWPADAGFDSSVWMQIALEPLIRESFAGEYSPLLAESWTIDYDAPSVTFKLRDDVKFHDGTAFNAEAVKFNLDYMIPTQISSVATWKSVDVIDEYTVRVNLTEWTNSALSNFAFSGRCYMVSPTAYEQHGIDWMRDNMVGTGPFMQDYIDPGIRVVYKKNPNYWDKDADGNQLPYLDGIEYWGISDPMTLIASLKSGEIMGMSSAADKNLYELQQAGYDVTVAASGVGSYFPDSSHADSPLSKLEVREAVEYALDKEAISDALSYGFWEGNYQIAPPASTAYDSSLPGRHYDQDKAKQLLTAAGYPDGISIKIIGTSDNKDIMTAMQAQLADVNIDVELEMPDSAKYQEYGLSGWTNGYLYGSPFGASNWIFTLSNFLNPNSDYYATCLRTDEFKNLFNTAMNSKEKDPVKEQAVIDYIYNTAMILPMENKVRGWVTANTVKDGGFFTDSSAFYWTPAKAWIEK
jgi:peptide/nickel transport system substrate-binding protein